MTALTLTRFIEKPAQQTLDCLIIGGGITGAALAYEAASRGYTTALVEKDDFGGATSAATGKLIHGGLRYLKQFEIGLVRESLKERRTLSNIAPNLIYPFPMILPNAGIVEKLGLTAYDLLSFDRNRVWDKSKKIPGFRLLSPKASAAAGPASTCPPSGRAIRYYDCLCLSPERLTLAFIKSAAAHGAAVANYTRATGLIIRNNCVLGARVIDRLSGKTIELNSRVTVNAAGPWTQDLLNTTQETKTALPPMRSEGIYLVTRKLTDEMMLYVGNHGHFSFAPWRNHSLIGPTDTPYHGPVDKWKLTRKSVDDFIKTINRAAGLKTPLTRDHVKFVYGGLRPLAESGSQDTYNASRRSDLHDHEADGICGLITAAGGKYTTSREFACQIFNSVARKVGKPTKPGISETQHLFACDIKDIEAFIPSSQAAHPAFSRQTIDYLIRHYGREYKAVIEIAKERPALSNPVNPDGEILAQVLFALRHEMARSLTDIFFRRTGMGWLGHPGDKVIEAAAALAAEQLDWSDKKRAEEIKMLKNRFVIP